MAAAQVRFLLAPLLLVAPSLARAEGASTQPASSPSSRPSSGPLPVCPAAGPPRTLSLGAVGESCRRRADCAPGLRCLDLVCRSPLEGRACAGDTECGAGLSCVTGQCTRPASFGDAAYSLLAPEKPDRFALKQGTMTVGGEVSITYELVRDSSLEPGLADDDVLTGYRYVFTPSLGYFIADGLQLSLGLEIGGAGGDLYPRVNTAVGFNVGARYYFATGSRVRPYLGLGFSLDYSLPPSGESSGTASFLFPMGVLVGVHRHVALHVGLRPALGVGVKGLVGSFSFQLPFGYFGLMAFF